MSAAVSEKFPVATPTPALRAAASMRSKSASVRPVVPITTGIDAGEGEVDVAADDGRVRVVDQDVGAAVERALQVVLDGDADGRSEDDLADVAADLAPGDGRVQAVAVGRDDAPDEPAADGAERSRDADVEFASGHGRAIVPVRSVTFVSGCAGEPVHSVSC